MWTEQNEVNFIGKYSLKKGKKLSKCNVTKTFDHWGAQYLIEFDILVERDIEEDWVNVFHMTDKYNFVRVPSLSIRKSPRDIEFQSCDEKKYIPFNIGRNYHIEIVQLKTNILGQTLFGIWIDNELHHVQKIDAIIYEKVYLYLSDPWLPSFEKYGVLKNLRIIDLERNFWSSKIIKREAMQQSYYQVNFKLI